MTSSSEDPAPMSPTEQALHDAYYEGAAASEQSFDAWAQKRGFNSTGELHAWVDARLDAASAPAPEQHERMGEEVEGERVPPRHAAAILGRIAGRTDDPSDLAALRTAHDALATPDPRAPRAGDGVAEDGRPIPHWWERDRRDVHEAVVSALGAVWAPEDAEPDDLRDRMAVAAVEAVGEHLLVHVREWEQRADRLAEPKNGTVSASAALMVNCLYQAVRDVRGALTGRRLPEHSQPASPPRDELAEWLDERIAETEREKDEAATHENFAMAGRLHARVLALREVRDRLAPRGGESAQCTDRVYDSVNNPPQQCGYPKGHEGECLP